MLGNIPESLKKRLEPIKQEQLEEMVAAIAQAGGSISAEELSNATLDQLFNSLNPNSLRIVFVYDKELGA